MYDVILPLKLFKSSKLTILAVLAVAVSVFIVIVVMTVMNGLTVDFIEKNHGFYSDCIISTDSMVGFADYDEFLEVLRKQEFIESATPVINSFGLVKSETSGKNAALNLMGFDVDNHFQTTNFEESIYYRKSEPKLAFSPSYNPNLPGCVIGIDLIADRDEWGNYSQWSFLPRYSYEITCFPLTPRGTIVRTGTAVSANTKTFYYSDNSNTGLAKVDGTTVYLPFEHLQIMSGMNIEPKRTSAIFVKFKAGYNMTKSVEKTTSLWTEFVAAKTTNDTAALNFFKNVNVQDFKSYKRETIAPMEKERAMMLLLFLMVGVITIFIIFVIFYMIVGGKNKDIGILKSLGASNFGIIRVFLRYAVLIGVVGAGIGIAAALLFLDNVNSLEGLLYDKFGFQMWNREMYAINDIPDKAGAALVLQVAGAAVLACLLGALWPTVKAARQNCVEILRVNQI
ncbi:MAG: hypothetical protein A2Y10_18780 [Planctomycetes bacterium GWF2_41_51]|nr:MAG: hypothetical protein A2Y10_18780 [Planctomycetes bacterium GWF2_41_51]HBG26764.1 hypothetical protein [Phycisphaerales bacterium]